MLSIRNVWPEKRTHRNPGEWECRWKCQNSVITAKTSNQPWIMFKKNDLYMMHVLLKSFNIEVRSSYTLSCVCVCLIVYEQTRSRSVYMTKDGWETRHGIPWYFYPQTIFGSHIRHRPVALLSAWKGVWNICEVTSKQFGTSKQK